MDDIIMNNKTGYLVPPKIMILNKILSILYKKINITKKEIKKIKNKFSNENISKININFYKKILNENELTVITIHAILKILIQRLIQLIVR